MKDYTYHKDYVNHFKRNLRSRHTVKLKTKFFFHSFNYYYVKQENDQNRGEKRKYATKL